jgi:uncharacterized membrane protein
MMLVLTFKIWATCLVFTVACVIANDFPKRKGGMVDIIVTCMTAGLVVIDVLLLFALMIMAIWS